MSKALSVPLSEIMATRIGTVDPSAFPDESFDLYSIPAFDAGEPEIRFGSEIGSSKQIIQPGDVLLSKIVPHIRRAWVVGIDRGKRIIGSGEWIVFRGSTVLPAYLRHVLVGDPFHREFMLTVSGVGGSLLRARPAYVGKIEIPLPPLPEQRRIAAILDQAEALRAKRRAAVTMLDSLAQSIFMEMFGDPSVNPKNWPICTIADLLESASYGTSEKSKSEGEFAVIRMNNITATGRMDLTDLKYMDLDAGQYSRYLVRAGDVLFNRTNSAELVGKSAIYRHEKPMAYAGYLIRLRVNKVTDPEYLAGFLNSSYAKRMLRGMCKSIIGMANINAKEIQSMKIASPPIKVQRTYAKQIDALEKLRSSLGTALNSHDRLFLSLQQRALQGEL